MGFGFKKEGGWNVNGQGVGRRAPLANPNFAQRQVGTSPRLRRAELRLGFGLVGGPCQAELELGVPCAPRSRYVPESCREFGRSGRSGTTESFRFRESPAGSNPQRVGASAPSASTPGIGFLAAKERRELPGLFFGNLCSCAVKQPWFFYPPPLVGCNI